MDIKEFVTENNLKLIVKRQKACIILELDDETAKSNTKDYNFSFIFSEEQKKELFEYLTSIAVDIWKGFEPKVATSMGSDYSEYYDRKLDNNGYLTIRKNGLFIERPTLESKKLYQFSRRKMESFIYDYNNPLTSN